MMSHDNQLCSAFGAVHESLLLPSGVLLGGLLLFELFNQFCIALSDIAIFFSVFSFSKFCAETILLIHGPSPLMCEFVFGGREGHATCDGHTLAPVPPNEN